MLLTYTNAGVGIAIPSNGSTLMEGQEKGLARTPSRGTEDSSATVAGAGDVGGLQRIVSRARSGSPLPDESVEKKERLSDDDWEDDPANPRNWSSGKKWTAVGIVRLVLPLFSMRILRNIHRSHSIRECGLAQTYEWARLTLYLDLSLRSPHP